MMITFQCYFAFTIHLFALLYLPTDCHTVQINRVCYLRPDPYFPIDIAVQQNLCTHIIIGFSSIGPNLQVSHDDNFIKFCRSCKRSIQNNGSNTKLMFSIGGGGAGGFKLASSTAKNRNKFVLSILGAIDDCNLDGLDIDWEFPAWERNGINSSARTEKDNFIYLLKEIRTQFNQYRSVTGKPLILSAAVAAQVTIIHVCYKPKEMMKYVDFINLMTYDFYVYKWYWPFVGHNSALHPRSADLGITNMFNTVWAANHWSSLGIDRRRIMVGIPTYGKRFTLFSKYVNFPGSIAASSNVDCTFSDVCDFLNLNDTVEQFDQQAKVPYAFNGYEWISYENDVSARYKAQWIKNNHYGGAMIFSLNSDDFRFRCSDNVPFLIHSTIRDILIY